MPKVPISKHEIKQIIDLRKTGHSINEIREIVRRGNSTVFKYIKNIKVLPQYKLILKSKQGGSIKKSRDNWNSAASSARKLIRSIVKRDRLLILAALYWGEGNKRELNLNNSDPILIRTFIECLKDLGVRKEELKITLRLYEDINVQKAKTFWANILDISEDKILGVTILAGKKVGKLEYGMCRVRVTRGAPYFKLIMSVINLIKSDLNAAVVQRIERGTPKP